MAAHLCSQLSHLRLHGRPLAVTRQTDAFRGQGVGPQALCSRPASRRVPLHIVAARVGGVEIPNPKRIEFALQYIYGIGPTTSKAILATTGIENKRTRELSEEELSALRAEIDNYTVEGDLRRFNSLNIKRLKDIQCYRGRRHIMGLPLRGQKTRNNARTRKGKPVAIAGKKK